MEWIIKFWRLLARLALGFTFSVVCLYHSSFEISLNAVQLYLSKFEGISSGNLLSISISTAIFFIFVSFCALGYIIVGVLANALFYFLSFLFMNYPLNRPYLMLSFMSEDKLIEILLKKHKEALKILSIARTCSSPDFFMKFVQVRRHFERISSLLSEDNCTGILSVFNEQGTLTQEQAKMQTLINEIEDLKAILLIMFLFCARQSQLVILTGIVIFSLVVLQAIAVKRERLCLYIICGLYSTFWVQEAASIADRDAFAT